MLICKLPHKLIKHIFLFFCVISKVWAQDNIGYVNGKYAGINSVYLNPTNLLNSKIFIDVQLSGLGVFAHNNIYYLPKKNFSPISGQFANPIQNLKEEKKTGFVNLKIHGPAVGVSYDNFSFGLFANGRVMGEAYVSKKLGSYLLNRLNKKPLENQQLKNEKAYLGVGAWTEFGFNMGYMYKRHHYSFQNIGFNLKYLIGISHLNGYLQDLDASTMSNKKIENIHFKASYQLAEPTWKAGKGMAVDVGWSFSKMLEPVSNYYPNNKHANGCSHIDYLYKIGIAITDIGFINYNTKSSAKTIEYQDETINLDSTKVSSISPNSIDQNISNLGKGLSVSSKDRFMTILPIGLNAQYDYNFENDFYLNSTLMIGPRVLSNQIKRPSILALTPRYDKKYFGIGIPISLYNWKYPQIGFSMRLGNNLIIGTDRAGFLIGKIRDTYGADLYFHLKFAIFKHCSKRKKIIKTIYDCITKNQAFWIE